MGIESDFRIYSVPACISGDAVGYTDAVTSVDKINSRCFGLVRDVDNKNKGMA